MSVCVSARACVCEGLDHDSCLFGEYFKLDYVELLSMKEDVWAGKGGGNTATMSIFT